LAAALSGLRAGLGFGLARFHGAFDGALIAFASNDRTHGRRGGLRAFRAMMAACAGPLHEQLPDMLKGCPAQLLDTKEGKCHAPRFHCGRAAHSAEPFCTALDA
jgi:hypothetical protein